MIFKNRIKKEKLSADIESLNSRIETLSDQVKKFYSTEGELRRILENHMHGEVTGFSDKDTYYTWGIPRYKYKTYVYKNGREYVFDNLYIKNPVFTQGDGTRKYVLDLYQNRAIEIWHRESDNKDEPQ